MLHHPWSNMEASKTASKLPAQDIEKLVVEDLTPLSAHVISHQATINIGMLMLLFGHWPHYGVALMKETFQVLLDMWLMENLQ